VTHAAAIRLNESAPDTLGWLYKIEQLLTNTAHGHGGGTVIPTFCEIIAAALRLL